MGCVVDLAEGGSGCVIAPWAAPAVIALAPGHCARSQADAAILVVNSIKGEFEAGFQTGGQTKEHVLLLKSLGVKEVWYATELVIISNEIEKSKPATLFFLSKFGCMFEKILFYNQYTEKDTLSDVDIIVSTQPQILDSEYGFKTIKYKTTYNENTSSDFEIETLKGFKDLYEKLNLK